MKSLRPSDEMHTVLFYTGEEVDDMLDVLRNEIDHMKSLVRTMGSRVAEVANRRCQCCEEATP